MATLAYRDILQKQTQNANQHSKKQSVLSHRITELATLLGSLISGVYLRIRSLCFQLFALYALYLWACIGVTIDPNPDLGDTL